MAVTTPFWFKQRQGVLTEAGPDLVKVSGPNLKEAFLGIRKGESGWSAFMRQAADGPDSISTLPEIKNSYDAWEVAFEMYRNLDVI